MFWRSYLMVWKHRCQGILRYASLGIVILGTVKSNFTECFHLQLRKVRLVPPVFYASPFLKAGFSMKFCSPDYVPLFIPESIETPTNQP